MVFALISIINSTKVHAILQANVPDTNNVSLTNQTVDQFFEAIRNMETEHGALGKQSNIDSTTALDSSKNGIDCHMALNTEWGTAAMLATSNYGTVPAKDSEDTTTGNESGIYQMGNKKREYVVAVVTSNENEYNTKLVKSNQIYKNIYEYTVSGYLGYLISKKGDGVEMGAWR